MASRIRMCPYLVSGDGTRVAFVQANELWYYDQDRDEISLLFSFRSAEGKDIRDLTAEHGIRLIAMDDGGNVTLRGLRLHEPGVSTKARWAPPSTTMRRSRTTWTRRRSSPAINPRPWRKMSWAGSSTYSAGQDRLYVLAGGTLYEIDMKKEEQTVLAEELEEGQYVTSEDGHLAAWQTDGSLCEASRVTVMDLESGENYEVSADDGASIRPLGFINTDFVCGMSRQGDAGSTISGGAVYPMYKVEILSGADQVERTYESDTELVLGAEVADGMINLDRVVKSGGSYSQIAASQITSNEEKKESNIFLESYVTDLKRPRCGSRLRTGSRTGIPRCSVPSR